MNKLPLICAKCGFVITWARRATNDKRPCPRCHRYTVFHITEAGVSKELQPQPITRDRESTDFAMRNNCGVDSRKC